MNPKIFYKELGKLLYAIAKADGTIRDKEIEMLRSIVRKELVPVEATRDAFGTDNAFYTEFEFETLEEFDADQELAFDSFASYVKNHKNEFSADLQELCLRLVSKVGDAFKGTNRAEEYWINKLKIIFNQL